MFSNEPSKVLNVRLERKPKRRLPVSNPLLFTHARSNTKTLPNLPTTCISMVAVFNKHESTIPLWFQIKVTSSLPSSCRSCARYDRERLSKDNQLSTSTEGLSICTQPSSPSSALRQWWTEWRFLNSATSSDSQWRHFAHDPSRRMTEESPGAICNGCVQMRTCDSHTASPHARRRIVVIITT